MIKNKKYRRERIKLIFSFFKFTEKRRENVLNAKKTGVATLFFLSFSPQPKA